MPLGLNTYPPIDSREVHIAPEPATFPGLRYLARKVDYIIVGLLAGAACALFGYSLNDGNLATDLLFDIGSTLAWIPFEAALLARFGATPGKFMLGMRVTTSSGALLSFPQALRRSGIVAVAGVGCGVGLISMICMWRARRDLIETSTTSWDGPHDHRVPHQGIPWLRLLAGALVLALTAALFFMNGLLVIPYLDELTSLQ